MDRRLGSFSALAVRCAGRRCPCPARRQRNPHRLGAAHRRIRILHRCSTRSACPTSCCAARVPDSTWSSHWCQSSDRWRPLLSRLGKSSRRGGDPANILNGFSRSSTAVDCKLAQAALLPAKCRRSRCCSCRATFVSQSSAHPALVFPWRCCSTVGGRRRSAWSACLLAWPDLSWRRAERGVVPYWLELCLSTASLFLSGSACSASGNDPL